MNTSEIINKVIEYSGLSPAKFAAKIQSKTSQAIYDLQSGKTKTISSEMENKIISCYPEINKIWLHTGEGEMLKESNDKICQDGKGEYITYLLPMRAMGGSLTGVAQDGVSLQNCEQVISPIKGIDFAITVYGESMAPEYPSGSRMLIKQINPNLFIDWGKVYVLDTPNGIVVKEIRQSEREGYISCYSINPDPKFKPFDIPMCEIFGIYRVLMCLSAK